MGPLIILIGPHGVGKTTIGKLLAERLGWHFSDEIGETLRRRALAFDANQHAMIEQPNFDQEVIRSELERDLTAPTPRVIETWHVGNLAYARLRSPDIASRYESEIRKAIQGASPVWVQPLRAKHGVLEARCREPGPASLLSFFAAVAEESERITRQWQLAALPPKYTDSTQPEVLVSEIQQAILKSYSAERLGFNTKVPKQRSR